MTLKIVTCETERTVNVKMVAMLRSGLHSDQSSGRQRIGKGCEVFI